jgi:hypothetical protein
MSNEQCASLYTFWSLAGDSFGELNPKAARLQGHGIYTDAIEKVLSANQNVARLCEEQGITRDDFSRKLVNFRQWVLDSYWSANQFLTSICADAEAVAHLAEFEHNNVLISVEDAFSLCEELYHALRRKLHFSRTEI